MIAVKRSMAQPEVREKLTLSILEAISDLPDNQKKMFTWKHYCGWSAEEIAENLQCSLSDVEAGLDFVDSVLTERAGSLLVQC